MEESGGDEDEGQTAGVVTSVLNGEAGGEEVKIEGESATARMEEPTRAEAEEPASPAKVEEAKEAATAATGGSEFGLIPYRSAQNKLLLAAGSTVARKDRKGTQPHVVGPLSLGRKHSLAAALAMILIVALIASTVVFCEAQFLLKGRERTASVPSSCRASLKVGEEKEIGK